MTAITITDLNNAKLDVDHIAAIANSASPTATNRLGGVSKTVAGLSAEFVNAGIYTTTALGIAATSSGQHFSTLSPDSSDYLILYVNSAGVAAEVKRYPSSEYVKSLEWDTQVRQAHIVRDRAVACEALGGSFNWDGTTTVGATGASGGFKVPAGATGQDAYLRITYPLSAVDHATFNGRPMRFCVELKTSANFESTRWTKVVQKNGQEATAFTPYFQRISDTRWLFYWDCTFDNTVASFSSYFQSWSSVKAADMTVWVVGQYVMPQDNLGFRDAVQASLGTVATDISDLQAWRDTGVYQGSWPKFELDPWFLGENFNGSTYWNGAAAVATNELTITGGLRIPAGQTGNTAYTAWGWQFSFDDRANFGGRTFRILVPITTSSNFDTIGWVIGCDASGTPGTFANQTLYKLSSTSYLLSADYTASGNESLVRVYLQNPTTWVKTTDITMIGRGQFVVPMDIRGFTDVMNYYTQAFSGYALQPVNDVGHSTFYGQAFNGGLLNVANGRIDLPVNVTGVTTYVQCQLPLHLDRLSSGTKVELMMELDTSDNFALTNNLSHNLNGHYDGVFEASVGVADTIWLSVISSTRIRVMADYSIRGSINEVVGLYVMVAGRSNTTVAAWLKPVSVKYKLKTLDVNEAVLHRRLIETQVTSGDLYEYSEPLTEIFNGGVYRDGGWGFTIPAGSAGWNTYSAYKFPVSHIAKFKGSQVRIRVLLRTSDNLMDYTGLSGNLSKYVGTILTQSALTATFTQLNKNCVLAEYTYKFDGTETHLRPFIQVSTNTLRTSEGWLSYAGMYLVFESVSTTLTPGGLSYSLSDMAVTFRQGLSVPDVSSVFSYLKTVTVKPDGSGNYTTLALAIATEGGGTSTTKRVLYKVYEGIYTDVDTWIPDFVDIVGIGQRDQIWFKGYKAPSTPVAEIPNHQTWYWNYTARISNVKVTAQNMRYPIHSDSGASGNHAYQLIEDCYVEHLGNEEARAYQTANSGDANAVWSSEHAWGCGTHSGQSIISRRTKWVSRTTPFYFHTNGDFAEPTYVELEDSECLLTTQDGWSALALQPLGSGTPDRLVVRNCTIAGRLNFTPVPMLSQRVSNYRGNMNSEIEVYISGSSPVAWDCVNYNTVLELKSVDAVGSAVTVSGTAMAALFGVSPEYQFGGSGYAARVWSAHAIGCYNGFAGLNLGSRLGDCSVNTKTLSILFDGTINKTITLNQNFSVQSNATILATLNGLLADGSGRAFAETNPYDGVAKVYQIDRELRLKNNSAAVILKGQVAAFDGSKMLTRKATSSDARSLIAGIALENIAPGHFGRVQFNGQFMSQQLVFDGAPSLAFGDTFGVGTVAGSLIETATVKMLRCIEIGTKPVFEII